MTEEDVPEEMHATVARRRIAWFIELHKRSGFEVTEEELADNFAATRRGPSEFAMMLRFNVERLGAGIEVIDFDDSQPGWVSARVRGENGRFNRFLLRMEEVPPYRILGTGLFAAPPGWSVRRANEDDAAVLAEIERSAPLVLGETEVVYDRSADYFAAERLMGNAHTFVVELDGRPVGLNCEVVRDIRVDGETFAASYNHRLRLLPEVRGQGVSGPLSEARMRVAVPLGARMPYAFISADNEAALSATSPGLRWPLQPERMVISTEDGLADGPGRPATERDCRRLVELFNHTHGEEELFVPYTPESLSSRLSRDPSLYSWSDILVSARAAVGVWEASLGVERRSSAGDTRDTRALVLDYGFEEGAEDEFVVLLAQCAERLRAGGTTELSIFTSPPSPGNEALRAIAKRVEPYFVSCGAKPGPDLESRGIYVDQLYF